MKTMAVVNDTAERVVKSPQEHKNGIYLQSLVKRIKQNAGTAESYASKKPYLFKNSTASQR